MYQELRLKWIKHSSLQWGRKRNIMGLSWIILFNEQISNRHYWWFHLSLTHITCTKALWRTKETIQMWEFDHKEGWMSKNWCFQIMMLQKTLDSPLDSKEIKPVNPSQPWIFTGKTDVEAEVPIFWPLGVKSSLIGKDPGAGKYWRQKEKGMAEDEMIR